MNKFIKIFFNIIIFWSPRCSNYFATQLYQSSESAFESSQNTKDSQRKSTLRDSKVDPENNLYQFYS